MIWSSKNFFEQTIDVENIKCQRLDFFKDLCFGKKVLHIGCADAMFFNCENNLHIEISKSCRELHGMDISLIDIENIKNYVNGKYFQSILECDTNYDLIIAPEVIEHVDNLKIFLDQIFSLSYEEMFITAPNIMHYSKEMKDNDTSFFEIVHPDHKCWFSPYTLYNVTKGYVNDKYEQKMYYLENKSMIGTSIKIKKG